MADTTIDTGTAQLTAVVRGGVAVLTLNRPDARNALSDEMSGALRRQIAERALDPAVGAILITGAGSAFCSGGDVKNMGANRKNADAPIDRVIAEMRARHQGLTGALAQVRKPTIAALPGAAAGAGLALALACDLRIAARSAFASTGYAKIGLSGDYGIAWLMTRAAGPARARELMLTSERVDAERAERLGLFHRVVDDAALADASFKWAAELAAGPRVAVGLIKDNLDEALDIDYRTAIDREAERLARARGTADHHEAVRAFVEKRKPVFTGR
ncbi:MAG: enoyl-CoA hydratase [Alphaproteobacteria bacterium]|nr:enoyl-CoA hydratase [Alphaproteobacteria bacterium]